MTAGRPVAGVITWTVHRRDPELAYGDTLTITAPTKPTWLTLVDHGNGTATLSGTPISANLGQHEVVLRVTDQGGLSAEQTFTIGVLDRVYLPLVVRTQ